MQASKALLHKLEGSQVQLDPVISPVCEMSVFVAWFSSEE